ncbi:MAG TPA: selenocysteine-specific translation elongation factor [Desulfotomaculum sp.]|jgi:selenocysteine-specific elongation factor|nr:selenocysteine-specific translation elongation factor [Desulfotomaculum sp.]
MTNLIIGTAGHVDHGKTMLVKALTGIDTDRLKVEKERGISIELGFAFCQLPGGRRAGIVDVPGHERFIKNMLAGVGGIDLVLLVIAADEGVMPQTREHMDIIQLLQINKGVVALTKIDLVDKELLELVHEEVDEFLQNTTLKNAPVVEVSAVTGQGLEELLREIDNIPVEGRSISGPVRLPVDRVFSVTGFGTVVTGTLWSGVIRSGDTLEIMPQGLITRVRSLQVHGKKVNEAQAGQRVAVNITGVDIEQAPRGTVLTQPSILKPSYRVDARLLLLKNAPRPLINRARVRFYLSTIEVLGRVILLDREELAPGETTYVQFSLEEPVVALKGDRFVIRSYSPIHTTGGGVVINPAPKKHKRMREEVIQTLVTRERGRPAEQVENYLDNQAALLAAGEITAATGISPKEATEALTELGIKDRVQMVVVDNDKYFVSRQIYQRWVGELKQLLSTYHRQYPLREGFPREELRSRLFSGFASRQLQSLLKVMEENQVLKLNLQTVALPGFQTRFDSGQQELFQQLETIYREQCFQPPGWDSVSRQVGLNEVQSREVLQYCLHRGILVKVADDIYFHAAAIDAAKKLLLDSLEAKGEISVGEARNILQTSRKYALPLLEYFDRVRITRRVGDKRVAVSRS